MRHIRTAVVYFRGHSRDDYFRGPSIVAHTFCGADPTTIDMRRHEALRLSQADRHEWKVCPPCYIKAKEES